MTKKLIISIVYEHVYIYICDQPACQLLYVTNAKGAAVLPPLRIHIRDVLPQQYAPPYRRQPERGARVKWLRNARTLLHNILVNNNIRWCTRPTSVRNSYCYKTYVGRPDIHPETVIRWFKCTYYNVLNTYTVYYIVYKPVEVFAVAYALWYTHRCTICSTTHSKRSCSRKSSKYMISVLTHLKCSKPENRCHNKIALPSPQRLGFPDRDQSFLIHEEIIIIYNRYMNTLL